MSKSRFVVFHDYGMEGWKIVAETGSILEAVEAREADVTSGGGKTLICEVQDLYDAYRRADYERDAREREAAKPA